MGTHNLGLGKRGYKMKTTEKFDAKKCSYGLSYKFIQTQTLNKLNKIINLLDFIDEKETNFSTQRFIEDETALSCS